MTIFLKEVFMKKRKKLKESKIPLSNPVAKFAYHFNKSKVFKDKTKYQRKAKHKESFLIVLFSTLIGKDFFYLTVISAYQGYSCLIMCIILKRNESVE